MDLILCSHFTNYIHSKIVIENVNLIMKVNITIKFTTHLKTSTVVYKNIIFVNWAKFIYIVNYFMK